MSKEKAKEKIKKLIEKYERLDQERVKKYKEANTRKDFILPLFQVLGWDIHNAKADEVIEEEDVSGKSVDYAFKIDGITKFHLEAKPFRINLDEEKWANQAIWYAWHQSVPWVILTNFKSIKVYNAEWDEPEPENSLFFEIKYQDYLKDFERLWWLSKQGFQKETLDREALKWGHKPKRIPVDKQLASDLIRWRDWLYKELKEDNTSVNVQKISEAVQIILDRLIFIRTTEDRNIEERNLQRAVRTWEDLKKIKVGELIKRLNQLFRQYDKNYNSKLFESRSYEQLTADDNIYVDIIKELYKNQRGIRYNFAAIKADVFGSIYEQYLGHIQQENGGVKDKKSKRKSQGIYYTPRYIVDYIVKNTLGEVLKERSPEEIRNIKILDPACGSGSFLIKALEELISYWQTKISKITKYEKGTHLGNLEKAFKIRDGQKGLAPSFKMDLLRNNIYGVDLDEKAVEIAQLNLLLRIMQRRQLLPNLSYSLTCGNSLISGAEKELKKYFKKDWKNKKSFNWQKEFPNVFKQGGFDVVIGNPPWGADIDDDIKYLEDKYPNSTKQHKDIYKIFVERAIQLLKKGGVLGFIIPNTILLQPRFKDIRRFLNKYKILYIANLGEKVFEGVEAPSCIIICQKLLRPKNHKVKIFDLASIEDSQLRANKLRKGEYTGIAQSIYDKSPDNAFVARYEELKDDEVILDEVLDIKDAGIKYQRVNVGMREKGKSDLAERLFYEGVEEKENDKKYIIGKDVDRYFVNLDNDRYFRNNYKEILKKNEIVYFNKDYFNKEKKILWRQTSDKLKACIVGKIWFTNTLQVGILKEEYEGKLDLKYILALLNSKYLNSLYEQLVRETGRVFPQVKLGKVKQLPIKINSLKDQKPLIKLADKMLKLNKELQKLHPIMDDKEYNHAKEEIDKLDKQIDKMVYKLYGLTSKEIKIVEESH